MYFKIATLCPFLNSGNLNSCKSQIARWWPGHLPHISCIISAATGWIFLKLQPLLKMTRLMFTNASTECTLQSHIVIYSCIYSNISATTTQNSQFSADIIKSRFEMTTNERSLKQKIIFQNQLKILRKSRVWLCSAQLVLLISL